VLLGTGVERGQPLKQPVLDSSVIAVRRGVSAGEDAVLLKVM
jgi:hypothetical protein